MPDLSRITAYLAFNGNCREAMQFYKECLGGRLLLQSMEQSPLGKRMPSGMKKHILHAVLKGNAFTIFGTDVLPEEGRLQGNNIMMAFMCSNKKQLHALCKKLSGNETPAQRMSLDDQSMVEVKDKYGNCWLLYCKAEAA
jgi:PhnB protein